MKKILILITAIIGMTIFSSCKKEDEGLFNLRFSNNSTNPYLVECDGKSNYTLPGNTYIDYKLKKGTYSWRVTQQSGYVIYPTVLSGTVTLDQDKQISFP